MAVTQHNSGDQSALTLDTETFLGTDPDTTAGEFQFMVEVSNMARADRLVIRLYEKINGTGDTARVFATFVLTNEQTETNWISPKFALVHGWRFSLEQTDGTGRAYAWSIRKIDSGTAQTGDSFARLGAPAGASIAADLVAIEAQTDDIGAAGAGLTAIPAGTLTASERDSIAAALLDLSNGIETGYTPRQAIKLMAAVLCGKVSGGPGSPVFRDLADGANRVSSTADSDGNRTAVTLNP